jgi:hypothetical protein
MAEKQALCYSVIPRKSSWRAMFRSMDHTILYQMVFDDRCCIMPSIVVLDLLYNGVARHDP